MHVDLPELRHYVCMFTDFMKDHSSICDSLYFANYKFMCYIVFILISYRFYEITIDGRFA